jgi:Flp pilus assembly protein TadD
MPALPLPLSTTLPHPLAPGPAAVCPWLRPARFAATTGTARTVRSALLWLMLLMLSAVSAWADPRADAQRIQDLVRTGNAAAALPLAAQAALAHPQDAPLRFLHGVVLMELQRDAEALALFQEFNQLWPEMPDPLNNIALLHARAGRLDEALHALQAALRSDPAHRAARLNLGEVHLALAVRAWETAAASAVLEPPMQLRLQAARGLLAGAGR